jgi:hypothetical protein
MGATRFRGWGQIPEHFRDEESKDVVLFVYSYDTFHRHRHLGVTPETLAALVNDRGRLSAQLVRTGSARRRLKVTLSPLTLTEGEAVIAAVPGAKLRPQRTPRTFYQVDIRSRAAVAFVDRVVDLFNDSQRSLLSAALDEVDHSQVASMPPLPAPRHRCQRRRMPLL